MSGIAHHRRRSGVRLRKRPTDGSDGTHTDCSGVRCPVRFDPGKNISTAGQHTERVGPKGINHDRHMIVRVENSFTPLKANRYLPTESFEGVRTSHNEPSLDTGLGVLLNLHIDKVERAAVRKTEFNNSHVRVGWEYWILPRNPSKNHWS